MREYSEIIQAGKDCVYLDKQKGVCGLLKCIDDKIVDKDKKTHQKQSSTFSRSYVKTRWKGGD